jgi:hypothetical protein
MAILELGLSAYRGKRYPIFRFRITIIRMKGSVNRVADLIRYQDKENPIFQFGKIPVLIVF